MKTKIYALASLFLFCMDTFSQTQTSLTLQPDSSIGKDALLHGLISEVNTNYGSCPQFTTTAWTFQGVPGIVRSVIEFDLTSIPLNAFILDARLSLYAWNSLTGLGPHSTLSGPNDCWLERVTSHWTESTVTWNTQPSTTTLHRVSLPPSASGNQDYLNIDVTTLVQDMVNYPDSSFGFMLKIQNENFYRCMNFCSSDHPDREKHPKLYVSYSLTTGIQHESGGTSSINIYPNPSSGCFSVDVERTELSDDLEFYLYNSLGDIVKKLSLLSENNTIDKGNLIPGIYFYRLQNNKGIIKPGKLIFD